MGLFDNAVEVVINNKVVQSIKTPRGGTLYEKGNGTVLTINVPLNIVYSDAFNISGTLKDSNQTGLSGETVKLKVGSTVVDSTTTTTGGAYSFTQTPVATGNHSFQVVYEGSLDYNASQSTVVNRVVNKETTVLSVTNPTDNYLTYDSSITFTGTLTDDDGTVLVNKTINIKEGNNTVTSTTTDSNGAFSTGLYSVSAGTHNFSIVYEGDSNYTSSSVSRTVIIREHDYAISISADKPILSYSDGEHCTVTAVLTDNSVFVDGETLSYTVKHGSTVLDSGSAVTDANGSISFSYTATGVGDVSVEVSFGILLQETYEVKDLLFYDNASTDKSSNYQITLIQTSGTISLSHNTDKYVLTNSNNNTKAVKFLSDIPTDCIIEVDHNSGDNNIGIALMDNSNNKNAMCFNTYHTEYGAWKYNNGSWSDWYSGSYSQSSSDWIHVKIIKQGTNLKIQYYTQNDVLLATKEIIATTYSKYDVGICTGNTRTAYFKNIKVKAL